MRRTSKALCGGPVLSAPMKEAKAVPVGVTRVLSARVKPPYVLNGEARGTWGRYRGDTWEI